MTLEREKEMRREKKMKKEGIERREIVGRKIELGASLLSLLGRGELNCGLRAKRR